VHSHLLLSILPPLLFVVLVLLGGGLQPTGSCRMDGGHIAAKRPVVAGLEATPFIRSVSIPLLSSVNGDFYPPQTPIPKNRGPYFWKTPYRDFYADRNAGESEDSKNPKPKRSGGDYN
jgi:hypothetical protein